MAVGGTVGGWSIGIVLAESLDVCAVTVYGADFWWVVLEGLVSVVIVLVEEVAVTEELGRFGDVGGGDDESCIGGAGVGDAGLEVG